MAGDQQFALCDASDSAATVVCSKYRPSKEVLISSSLRGVLDVAAFAELESQNALRNIKLRFLDTIDTVKERRRSSKKLGPYFSVRSANVSHSFPINSLIKRSEIDHLEADGAGCSP